VCMVLLMSGDSEATYIYSPRTNLYQRKAKQENLLNDMILSFHKDTVDQILSLSVREPWVTECEFISIVQHYLQGWQPELEYYITANLCRVFREIDIFQRGRIEWEDFTNYIIDKAIALKNVSHKEESLNISFSSLRPSVRFENTLCKPTWIPGLDRLAFFEEESDKVYFMNMETG
jgi:hypothetical protein